MAWASSWPHQHRLPSPPHLIAGTSGMADSEKVQFRPEAIQAQQTAQKYSNVERTGRGEKEGKEPQTKLLD